MCYISMYSLPDKCSRITIILRQFVCITVYSISDKSGAAIVILSANITWQLPTLYPPHRSQTILSVSRQSWWFKSLKSQRRGKLFVNQAHEPTQNTLFGY